MDLVEQGARIVSDGSSGVLFALRGLRWYRGMPPERLPVHLVHRLVIMCCLACAPAVAQEPEASPELPLLAEPGGEAQLEELLAVPWASLAEARVRDLPALTEHWTRVSTAFFAYSGAMANGQPVMREWAAVTPVMLRLGGLLSRSGDAVLSALPAEDPTRPQREAGVAGLRDGLARMSKGALLVLVEMPEDVRRPYVEGLAESLPVVLEAMPPAEAAALRAQVRGAGVFLSREEAAALDTAAGQTGAELPEPPLVAGAPDRLLVAQSAAGWAGDMPDAWASHLLTVDWERHATDREALKADAFALLVGGHAWLTALGEGRITGAEAVAPLIDAALRAGTEIVAADVRVADRALFEERLCDLVLRAVAAASHLGAKDRAPLADVLEVRVPALLRALPSGRSAELTEALRQVADKRLAKSLGL